MFKKQEIMIFGASEKGKRAYEKCKYLYNVVGFIDNDVKKWGRSFLDKKIYSPEYLNEKKLKILVASSYYKEICKQLNEMNIKSYKVFSENLCFIDDEQSELEYKNIVESGFYESINEIKFMNNIYDKSLRSEFVSFLNEKFLLKGANILEIGCGSGQFLMELSLRNVSKCVGLDKCDENLAFASRIKQKYKLHNCEFIQYNNNFNFKDKEFDIAFNINMFAYLNKEEIELVFREMNRVAKYVVIVSKNSDSLGFQMYSNYIEELNLWEDISLMKPDEVEQIMDSLEYIKLDSRTIGFINESLNYKIINEVLMQNNIKNNLISMFEGKQNIGNWNINVYSSDLACIEKFHQLEENKYLRFYDNRISLVNSYYPKVSIVICFLNAEKFIDQLIDNLIKVEYDNLEFIFINDGSIDKSEIMLREKITYLNIKNYKIISFSENRGLFMARFEGVKNSTGEYIFFQDVDDIIMSKGLIKLANDIRNFEDSIHLNVSCAIMEKCKFNSSIWACKYLVNNIEYICEETIGLTGLVSLFHTLIKKDILINAYDNLSEIFNKLNVRKYIYDEDTIVTSFLILNGYIDKIIPVFYTLHGYEYANEASVSKKTDITLRDQPFRIAYCMQLMSDNGVISKSQIEEFSFFIKSKASEKFGDEFCGVFMNNYNEIKCKMNSEIK